MSGAALGEAARTVATAAFLDDAALAPTHAALVGGRLTGNAAADIASAAAASPAAQDHLLTVAESGTAETLRDERRKRVTREMALSTRDLGDGMGQVMARMPTSWLARVMVAVHEQHGDHPGDPPTPVRRRE